MRRTKRRRERGKGRKYIDFLPLKMKRALGGIFGKEGFSNFNFQI